MAKRRRIVPAVCSIRGHDPDETWVLRPALVGAGIVPELVHFDRQCRRGPHLAQLVWCRVLGDVAPLPESMTLTSWLEHHGASIEGAPGGPVRAPDAAEIEALIRQALPT